MGVKSCNRKNCENIMCDIYVPALGYICYDCQRDFIISMAEKNIYLNTEHEIMIELGKFLESDKTVELSLNDFFKKYSE